TARLGLRSLGYIPDTSVLPDPGQPLLVARVSWGRRAAGTRVEQRLVGQGRARGAAPRGVGPGAPARGGAGRPPRGARPRRGYGAMLRTVADEGRRAALAAAVQEAERAHRLDRERVAELVRWAPAPGSPRTDGVPPAAYPARAEHTDPDFPGRDFAHGRGWGLPPLSATPRFRSAGVAAVLTTADDHPVDWIGAAH